MSSIHLRAILGLLSVVAVTSGCVTKSSTGPDPDPAGGIEFTVSPSTIYWIGPGSNPFCTTVTQAAAYGPYTWSLRETAGGTVTITSFSAVTTASTGAVILNGQFISTLAQDLTGTASSSIALAPNQSMTGQPRYSCQPSGSPVAGGFPIYRSGATSVLTVSGTDSNGTPVTSTATLTIEGF